LAHFRPGQKPVKGLSVDGAAPTIANIIDDTYKMYRPFLIVYEPQYMESGHIAVVDDFISFMLSSEGQTVLGDRGLVRIDILQEEILQ